MKEIIFIIFSTSMFAWGRDPFVLKPNQQFVSEEIVSIFENGTPEIQYDYAEKLKDWRTRGITFGRSGFTSCQDGYLVLENLKKMSPQNELVKFLPIMYSAFNGDVSCASSTRSLMSKNFINIFNENGNSIFVKKAQDIVYQNRYLNPSLKIMKKYNLNNFITFVVILDSYIQHGEGDDGEGIDAILKQINLKNPTSNNEEYEWIQNFLQKRLIILNNGDSEWRDSTPRVGVLQNLLKIYYKKIGHTISLRSEEYGNFDLAI